jgi:hypothetical protein
LRAILENTRDGRRLCRVYSVAWPLIRCESANDVAAWIAGGLGSSKRTVFYETF